MPGLGRRRAIDPKNVEYPMHRRMGALEVLKIPTVKTWGFAGHPLDQGDSGTCTGHAGAHFLHAAPLPHAGFIDPFKLYREAVLLDEYNDNDDDAIVQKNDDLQAGSSGTGVAKALNKRGLISEYLWAQRAEDAVAWVLTRGPVMVGTNWYTSMFEVDGSGYLRIAPGAGIAGGHEWLIRGADKKRGVVLMVNSWGTSFNRKGLGVFNGSHVPPGNALMDFDTLARLFHEDGDAVSAVEKTPEKVA